MRRTVQKRGKRKLGFTSRTHFSFYLVNIDFPKFIYLYLEWKLQCRVEWVVPWLYNNKPELPEIKLAVQFLQRRMEPWQRNQEKVPYTCVVQHVAIFQGREVEFQTTIFIEIYVYKWNMSFVVGASSILLQKCTYAWWFSHHSMVITKASLNYEYENNVVALGPMYTYNFNACWN